MKWIKWLKELSDRVAAIALAAATAVVFFSVVSRSLFGVPLPDAFDLTRACLGIAILWAIASATANDDNIKIDLVWQTWSARTQKIADTVARALFAGFMILIAWRLIEASIDTARSGLITAEYQVPTWPFVALASLGLLLAFVFACVHLFSPSRIDALKDHHESDLDEDRASDGDQ